MLGTEVKNNTIDVHLDGVFVENPHIFVILNTGRGGRIIFSYNSAAFLSPPLVCARRAK